MEGVVMGKVGNDVSAVSNGVAGVVVERAEERVRQVVIGFGSG